MGELDFWVDCRPHGKGDIWENTWRKWGNYPCDCLKEEHSFRDNSQYKGPKVGVGVWLMCSRNSKVALIYNGILLSHKMEQNWVICRDADGPRECHREWSKSEREKQISYIIAYMWNLEKWCKWSYLQSRNRDTDVENKPMDPKGEGGGWEELGDWDWHTYTSDTMYKTYN